MKLSVVIPAYNEEINIVLTCTQICEVLNKNEINYEIIVINDHSEDKTEKALIDLEMQYADLKYFNNRYPKGFGYAVRTGFENIKGDCVCLVMADLSDSPDDIVAYFRKLEDGYECVFGSRFIQGSSVKDYPKHKLVVNRLANWFIKLLFGIKYNDITNAFKAYKKEVIFGISPIISPHFNITVELPLKSIIRGYNYTIIPISWTNRVRGISKLKLKEMGSRYLFIVLYIFLEKLLTKKDYHRSVYENIDSKNGYL